MWVQGACITQHLISHHLSPATHHRSQTGETDRETTTNGSLPGCPPLRWRAAPCRDDLRAERPTHRLRTRRDFSQRARRRVHRCTGRLRAARRCRSDPAHHRKLCQQHLRGAGHHPQRRQPGGCRDGPPVVECAARQRRLRSDGRGAAYVQRQRLLQPRHLDHRRQRAGARTRLRATAHHLSPRRNQRHRHRPGGDRPARRLCTARPGRPGDDRARRRPRPLYDDCHRRRWVIPGQRQRQPADPGAPAHDTGLLHLAASAHRRACVELQSDRHRRHARPTHAQPPDAGSHRRADRPQPAGSPAHQLPEPAPPKPQCRAQSARGNPRSLCCAPWPVRP
jgi:hypothetical protein